MIAVELRGVQIMRCAYLYMVHVVLLMVCTQFYYVRKLCNMLRSICFLLIVLPTQNSDHIT